MSIDFTIRSVKTLNMEKESLPAVRIRKGRPPREVAASHALIMDQPGRLARPHAALLRGWSSRGAVDSGLVPL